MLHPWYYKTAFTLPNRLVESDWAQHVPFAFALVELHKPRLLVELGTYTGLSYCAFCQAVAGLNLPTKCYGVDTWEGDAHIGPYDEGVYADLSAYHDRYYSGFSSLLRMTFDEALKYFDDGTIDFLHIDGTHFYESVKHDFEAWLPKMSPSGVALFHDSCVRDYGFGVWRLIDELRQAYPIFEFNHGHGLAVVGVGSQLKDDPVWWLFQAEENEAAFLRGFFSAMGERVSLVITKATLDRVFHPRSRVLRRLLQWGYNFIVQHRPK